MKTHLEMFPKIALLIVLYGLLFGGLVSVSASEPLPTGHFQSNEVRLMTHHLIVDLDPVHHRLVARDRMVLQMLSRERRTLSFFLHGMLHVNAVVETSEGDPRPLRFSIEPEAHHEQREATQRVTIQVDPPTASNHTLMLEWHYEGTIDDPPREARQLRFVTPSETGGHIGPEGVYLSGETHWYPDLPGAIATFLVSVTTPSGWQAVSHGRLAAETVSRVLGRFREQKLISIDGRRVELLDPARLRELARSVLNT